MESQSEELSCDGGIALNTALQRRQQAPPADDSDMLLFPPPPSELSCHVADATGSVQWSTVGRDCAPFVANNETECLVGHNSVKPDIAAVQGSDVMPTETDIDYAMQINAGENKNSMLALIRQGVKLRKTVTNDRSAPKLN